MAEEKGKPERLHVCVICAGRALAHTVDEWQFSSLLEEPFRKALGKLMRSFYEAYDWCPDPLPQGAQESFERHLNYYIRYGCDHPLFVTLERPPAEGVTLPELNVEPVDNSLHDPPF